MRRKDREITDFKKIVEIISHCEVLRIGLCDGDFPYIIPVNFSYEVDEINESIIFYIHGAKAGRKYDLITKNQKCSFEMDNLIKIDYLYACHDITTRYESVMGTAKIEEIQESEKEHIMQEKILSRWEEAKNFPWNKDSLQRCAIFKIIVKSISCKANPLTGGAD